MPIGLMRPNDKDAYLWRVRVMKRRNWVALIIDMRGNGGGDDRVAERCAGRFFFVSKSAGSSFRFPGGGSTALTVLSSKGKACLRISVSILLSTSQRYCGLRPSNVNMRCGLS